jgi:outer membrane protein assembly factor BamB
MWRQTPSVLPIQLHALDGDVILTAASRLPDPPLAIVARLDGATGDELWQQTVDAAAGDLDVDPFGDVLAAIGDPAQVVKLAGADGMELWTHELAGVEVRITDQIGDGDGDVLVAGQSDDHPFVAKLASATGAELWRTSDATISVSLPPVVAVDSDGDAFVASGFLATSFDIRARKLAGGDGAVLWSRDLADGPGSDDAVRDIALTRGGNPVLAGGLDSTFALIELNSDDGHSLATLDIGVIKIGEKFRKKWLWGMKATGSALVLPPPFTADDPTIAGASIELFNPTTGERAVFHLPEGAHWTRLGNSREPGKKGYLYVDKTGSQGPCSQLKIVPGKILSLHCQVPLGRLAPPFSLDEAAQGALDVQLQIGAFRYCLSTQGGELLQDRAAIAGGRGGLFKVRNAPAPESCP